MAAEDVSEVILVGGMTRMPAVQQRVKTIFEKDPGKGVNPDEVVAAGAAIQGAILQGDMQDVLLLDVTPLSLGIETLGGVMTTLIEKNTTIPAKKSEIFSTAEDNQPAVSIHVLQGEREMAAGNKTLGRFELLGIAPAPRGIPQVEVTFDIDANGIVNVSAKDLSTGKAQSIRITASSGLTPDEIDRLIKEAEAHAGEDRRKRSLVDARNEADGLIYSVEKALGEMSGTLDAASKDRVQTAITSLSAAMKGEDAEEIRRQTEELKRMSHSMAESAYRRQDAGQPGGRQEPTGPRPQSGGADDDVVDADFEEVA
jgi:molecular chaperone DnaK